MPSPFVSRMILLLLLIAIHGEAALGKQRPKPSLIAWNEDTVHSFQFTLLDDRSFVYTITDNSGVKKEKQYVGKLRCMIGRDTVYLQYEKNKLPPGFTDYLVIEVSGTYLIQSFTNGQKRVFMRRQAVWWPR